MFDELSSRFENAVKGLRGEAKISENNINDALKEVKKALLDADVSLSVVKEFVSNVKDKAIGEEVVRGVNPGQKFIEVVNKELINIMGNENSPLNEKETSPTVILMAGLQGAGKTTATGKLGLYLKEKEKKVLLVAADIYRPAAVEQLKTIGNQYDLEVFSAKEKNSKPEEIAKDALSYANENNVDTLIVDTAGRLQIDESMMSEMVRIKEVTKPDEVLLVVDSMIGQEAADLTKSFHEKVGISGAILTKLDGDSRGGAALSIRKISGKPIKFIGTGEKIEALQPFHPERMASRILGMGDVLTLVEKAQKEVELADAEVMQKKLQEATFDFNDFVKQMRLMKRMGSLGGLIKLIPGMNKIDDGMIKNGEEQLKKIESMISSMTLEEKQKPEVLAAQPSRRQRIAQGSGYQAKDVDKVLADFQRMRGFMKQMSNGGMPGMGGGNGNKSFKKQKSNKKKKGFGDL